MDNKERIVLSQNGKNIFWNILLMKNRHKYNGIIKKLLK